MVDRYTKIVLTIIAGALVWLCLWGPGPAMLGTPAEAQGGTLNVNIEEVGGRFLRLSSGPLSAIPVEVEGEVELDEPVEVEGTVDIGNWSDASLWLGD